MKSQVMAMALCLSIAVGSSAFALTGDELLAQCSGKLDTAKEKECESYIVGVTDGVATLSTSMRLLHPDSDAYPKLFCAETATPEQLMRATRAYLLKNPSTRRFNAASEVMLALQQAFPCSK